ncbi:MAG: hypothetical protein IV107_11070 [Paucibacter sp.]|nr:hypothetical protein [Roseateles sp.]
MKKTDTLILSMAMMDLAGDGIMDDSPSMALIAEAGQRLLQLDAAYEQAMDVLRQIANMPRRTREQKLANSCVRFLDALDALEALS